MDFGLFCVSIKYIGDTPSQCLNQLLFLIIWAGFLVIVLLSKKYKFMMDWFMHKFGDFF